MWKDFFVRFQNKENCFFPRHDSKGKKFILRKFAVKGKKGLENLTFFGARYHHNHWVVTITPVKK